MQESAVRLEMPRQEEAGRHDECGGGGDGGEVKAEVDVVEERVREPPCPPHTLGRGPSHRMSIDRLFSQNPHNTHHPNHHQSTHPHSGGLSTCILEAHLPPRKRRIMFPVISLITSAGIASGIATLSVYPGGVAERGDRAGLLQRAGGGYGIEMDGWGVAG